MKNTFVKKEALKLVNGGYLVAGDENTPVTHVAFIEAQRKAEYLDRLSKEVTGKTFKDIKGADIEQLKLKVLKDLKSTKVTSFIVEPTKPTTKVTDSLRAEALKFMDFEENLEKVSQLNQYMTENFQTINEFEEFGLYFEEGIVKLNKIYTIKEILEFVTIIDKSLDL